MSAEAVQVHCLLTLLYLLTLRLALLQQLLARALLLQGCLTVLVEWQLEQPVV